MRILASIRRSRIAAVAAACPSWHARRCIVALAFFCMLACGRSADAAAIATPNATIDIAGLNTESGLTTNDQFLVPIVGGVFSAHDLVSSTDFWNATITDASGNADPFTNLAFGVTNISAAPFEFTFTITVPIGVPIPGATVNGGSTGGSVTDANNNGVGGLSTILSVPGTPFYSGQIDGVTVLPIYPDPTSFPAGGIFPSSGTTVNIPAVNPGLPGPTLPSGPALVTIGIVHHFLLAPGDAMSASSFFIVQAVPEPSSIVLAAFALLGLAAGGWRRPRR